jgi:hypothetical protein
LYKANRKGKGRKMKRKKEWKIPGEEKDSKAKTNVPVDVLVHNFGFLYLTRSFSYFCGCCPNLTEFFKK